MIEFNTDHLRAFQNFKKSNFLLIGFVCLVCRLRSCDTAVWGRQDLLHRVRSDRNPDDADAADGHGGPSDGAHDVVPALPQRHAGPPLPAVQHPRVPLDAGGRLPCRLLLPGAGRRLQRAGTRLELFRLDLLLFHLFDHHRTGRLHPRRFAQPTSAAHLQNCHHWFVLFTCLNVNKPVAEPDFFKKSIKKKVSDQFETTSIS